MPNLNDLFSRTGDLNGSTASDVGGIWQNHPSAFIAAAPGYVSLDGSKVTMGSTEPTLHTNSSSTASADQKVTLQFTPNADNWQVILLLRADSTSGAAYQLLFGPGAGGIGVYRRSNTSESWGGAAQIGSSVTNALAAADRSSHTLTFSIIGSAFSATLDGTPISLGSLSDGTITAANRVGFGGRSFTSDVISEDDETASGSTALGASLIATASMFGGSASGGVASGTFTSEVLKRNNGTVAASSSLSYVRFYNTSTGALVLSKTGLSTNGSGVFTTTDAALVSGTTYAIDWEEATGQRRMPRKAAT